MQLKLYFELFITVNENMNIPFAQVCQDEIYEQKMPKYKDVIIAKDKKAKLKYNCIAG